ncbi:hypothetical protein IWQ56_001244 [Coemansia nantahalensis]|uniref:Uncharacterized protein n=2 Tax=Coemansia TaxID=4863 RepID=A0ACC1L624_9FUNG|nr:hypothetical protein IWQ56_001244 [Coemansia nantahalensis]KAJ2773772.1 hypothetical protein IWQ57_001135 [Coemansia nantahalensis]KAJ2801314.1 hypothetical protein H4R21_002834 [Coemansia helicoidea]
MKVTTVPAILAALAVADAHYDCTTQQAFDVLFSNSTVDAFAKQLLASLQSGAARVSSRLESVDAEKAAQAILARYRGMVALLPPNVSASLPRI